jgi:hypothetical protein
LERLSDRAHRQLLERYYDSLSSRNLKSKGLSGGQFMFAVNVLVILAFSAVFYLTRNFVTSFWVSFFVFLVASVSAVVFAHAKLQKTDFRDFVRELVEDGRWPVCPDCGTDVADTDESGCPNCGCSLHME